MTMQQELEHLEFEWRNELDIDNYDQLLELWLKVHNFTRKYRWCQPSDLFRLEKGKNILKWLDKRMQSVKDNQY